MKVLIVEDELPAAKQLTKLIHAFRPQTLILETLDSVEAAVDWFSNHPMPELVFMDIQLADGLSFDIFSAVKITAPVIFTTAFDQYTLKAFKVNSVDYLLKPIEPEELQAAIVKFEERFMAPPSFDSPLLQQLLQSFQQPVFKSRFLIKLGLQLSFIETTEIRYFFSSDSLVYLKTQHNKKHLIDQPLDQLQHELDPKQFFRINRKAILCINAIDKIHTYFNSRLKVTVRPAADFDLIVSRDRVASFKNWLNGSTS
ncbi:MAG: response regulator transcription factor [Saprospiraceae bacterium]|nr:response regulator transcription factor [Saprospiraceae bacterium]